MRNEVYITRLASFLPGYPIDNDHIEDFLGKIGGLESKAKSLILRSNGIKKRYYSIDLEGNFVFSNADLTLHAIEKLFDDNFTQNDIQMLLCGTTSPDQLLPSHASMVHGLLGNRPLEVASFTSACLCGIQALKNGFLSIKAGNTDNAVCTGSERLSPWMKAQNFEYESSKISELEDNPYIAFEKEFLRWMLSDGAGAALIENRPSSTINLKIDWIEMASYAHEFESCMYAGSEKLSNGQLKGWYEFSPGEWLDKSIFSLKQDVKILRDNIVPVGFRFLKGIMQKRDFDLSTIDYFLPHLSSMFFKSKIEEELSKNNLSIPSEKWFTNLTEVGNVGAASAYLMLSELFHSGKLRNGQKILMMIPESARFSYAYVLLTVVM